MILHLIRVAVVLRGDGPLDFLPSLRRTSGLSFIVRRGGRDRKSLSDSLRFPFPCREEKAIDDPGFPYVFIASGGELARVAREDSCIVRQVVVQPEISALGVHKRDAIADDGVAAECLLHPE